MTDFSSNHINNSARNLRTIVECVRVTVSAAGHLTLKKEATKPAAFNLLQQQARFDDFIDEYNNDRPHQAPGMKYPGEMYTPSPGVYVAATAKVEPAENPFAAKVLPMCPV